MSVFVLMMDIRVMRVQSKQLTNCIYPGFRRHGTLRGCLRKNSSTTSIQHWPGGRCFSVACFFSSPYFTGADCASDCFSDCACLRARGQAASVKSAKDLGAAPGRVC